MPANGGLVMVNFYTDFVCCNQPGHVCALDDVANHIVHIRDVAGADHVGLGGDYDGVEALPLGLEDVSKYAIWKRAVKQFRVGIFLDFVWLTTRTPHGGASYVRGARRNRIDRHGGGIERLAGTRTSSRTSSSSRTLPTTK